MYFLSLLSLLLLPSPQETDIMEEIMDKGPVQGMVSLKDVNIVIEIISVQWSCIKVLEIISYIPQWIKEAHASSCNFWCVRSPSAMKDSGSSEIKRLQQGVRGGRRVSCLAWLVAAMDDAAIIWEFGKGIVQYVHLMDGWPVQNQGTSTFLLTSNI